MRYLSEIFCIRIYIISDVANGTYSYAQTTLVNTVLTYANSFDFRFRKIFSTFIHKV